MAEQASQMAGERPHGGLPTAEISLNSQRSGPRWAELQTVQRTACAQAQEASAHMDAWRAAGIRHFRLEFVHESGEEVQRVTAAFQAFLAGRITSGQLGPELKRSAPAGVTEGSLFIAADFELFPILQ